MVKNDKTTPDDSFLPCCFFGAMKLSGFIDTIAHLIERTRENKDIEYVHKMRVTSRRVRSILQIFKACYPKKDVRKWKQEIKLITKSLGDARDLDVQIQYMQNQITSMDDPDMKTGMSFLLTLHQQQRKKIQPQVVHTLDELLASRVLDEMTLYTQKVIKKATSTHISEYSTVTYDHAIQIIKKQLDEFLMHQDCIQNEADIEQHHQMRIAAKKLRYTMEIFKTLYPHELHHFISVLKTIQDFLGDIHDCDVWVEYIPQMITTHVPQTTKKNKTIALGLNSYLEQIKKRRKALFSEFKHYYETQRSEGFFIQLLDALHYPSKISSSVYRKIGILSDVHGNMHALDAVIKDAKNQGVDFFINAGDFVGYGANPEEVVQRLHPPQIINVIGNYDEEVISDKIKKKNALKHASLTFARAHLSKDSMSYLSSLKPSFSLKIDDRLLYMTHGSPDYIDEHLYEDTPRKRYREIAQTTSADIIITGHSHQPFSKTVDDVLFINPGSVGRPDDGNPQASYAILDVKTKTVDLHRIDYDVDGAVETMRDHHLPEQFAQMLLQGFSLDEIIKQEKKIKNIDGNTIRKIREIAFTYDKDHQHFEQVHRLSLLLFDELKSLHLLSNKERSWLECAALLHDIGWSQGPRGHHKKSLDLIRNDATLPLSSKQRYIIGSIARYHRKALPSQKHDHFSYLSESNQKKVEILASILRVADALDASHGQTVRDICIKQSKKKIIIKCEMGSAPIGEEESFRKKKDLFEKIFSKELVLKWTNR